MPDTLYASTEMAQCKTRLAQSKELVSNLTASKTLLFKEYLA